MRPPIFSFEDCDLIVFEIPRDAALFVEPLDVDVGESYDADGQLLRFETDGRVTRIRETGELRPEALRAALVAALSLVGEGVDPSAELDELVLRGRERFRYSPPRPILRRLRDRLMGHS